MRTFRSLDKVSTAFCTTTLVSKTNTINNLLTNSLVQIQQHPTRGVRSTVQLNQQYHTTLGASFTIDEKVLIGNSSCRGGVDSQTSTVQSLPADEEESGTTRSTTSTLGVTKPTTTLELTKVKQWTSEQVCSLLWVPEEQGGASLSDYEVQTLFDAKFDGNSVGNIIETINRHDVYFTIDRLKSNEDYKKVPQTTQETVVDWVDNLLKTKLYHLWSKEQVQDNLCKPIEEGGAGLNEGTPNLLKLLSMETYNKKNPIEHKVFNWKQSLQLPPLVIIDMKIDPFLRNLLKLAKTEIDTELVYSSCTSEYLKRHNLSQDKVNEDDFLPFIKDFKLSSVQHSITPRVEKILKPYLHFVFDDSIPYKFRKHYLPYLKKVRFGEEQKITPNSTTIMIAPSGVGKTSSIVKALCSSPGIYGVGTHPSEATSGQTTDNCTKQFLVNLENKNKFEAFACVKQSVQLLLITKLLHLHYIIESATSGKCSDMLKLFDENLFTYMAFCQSNGNTNDEQKVYRVLLDKFKYCEINQLRSITISLVNSVINQLKALKLTNNNIIPPEWNENNFLICLDEAYILDEHQFLSVSGTHSTALSVFVTEVNWVRCALESCASVYAGTSFTIDVRRKIRGSGALKTETEPITTIITDFKYLDKKEFQDFLSLHIHLNSEIDEQVNSIDDKHFPIRMRLAAATMESYIHSEGTRDINECFQEKQQELEQYITDHILKFLKRSADVDRETIAISIYECLLKFVFHHKFSEQLGCTFVEENSNIAELILKAGLTFPKPENMNTFNAKDPIGLMVVEQVFKELRKYIQKQSFILSDKIESLTLDDSIKFLKEFNRPQQ